MLGRSEEELKREHFRETMERLTAASHVQVEYFSEHKKIEGYYEENLSGKFFNCDRLLKQDNMYGTIQLGYNPNKKNVFLFAHMKTSKYDTVASHYQREMHEYKKKILQKGENINRAYVSKKQENAAVLIEKKENQPWQQRMIKTYLKRANMESVQKVMPFFVKEEEQQELIELKKTQKEIQEEIRERRIEQSREELKELVEKTEQEEEIRQLRMKAVKNLTKENLLEAILIRKSAIGKNFLRRLNYAYDYQKRDIEAYYREKRKALKEFSEHTDLEDIPEDEDR